MTAEAALGNLVMALTFYPVAMESTAISYRKSPPKPKQFTQDNLSRPTSRLVISAIKGRLQARQKIAAKYDYLLAY
jgi:hypothetical protein